MGSDAVGAMRSSRREGRAINALLGSAAIVAAVCGILSTISLIGARAISDAIGRKFLWAPLGWGGWKLLVQTVGMFPMGLAFTMSFLTSVVMRAGSGRDMYAKVVRDWIWGIGAGLLLLSVALFLRINLLSVLLIGPVVLGMVGMVLLTRQRVTLRPRRAIPPVEVSQRKGREFYLTVTGVVLTISLLLQLRVLVDFWGLHLAARVGWVAFSLALLGWFLRRVDRRSRPPGYRQQIGAVIGVITGLMIQSGLAGLAGFSRQGDYGVLSVCCAMFFVGVQVPVVRLGALVLSRRRKLFATSGARARSYAGNTLMGCALGFLVYLVVNFFPMGHVVLLGGGLGVLSIAVILGIGSDYRPRRQLQWCGWGAVLMCVLSAGVLLGVRKGLPAGGTVTTGTWLTSVGYRADRKGPPVRAGILPNADRWRGGAVTRTLARIMNAHPRRWWVVSTSDFDLPGGLPRGVSICGSVPDPGAVVPGAWGKLLAPGADAGFLQASQTSNERFDAVLLAPLSVDHPHAWRCYNTDALVRCVWRVHRDGPVLVRTQTTRGNFAGMLSVAKTFHSVVGSGWAVVEISGERMDMLLIGPTRAVESVPVEQTMGVFIVSTDRIWESWEKISPIQLTCPGALGGSGKPGSLRVRYWLAQAQKTTPFRGRERR